MLAPSLETLVALKPDVVIATTDGNREETFTQLDRLHDSGLRRASDDAWPTCST